MKFQEAYEKLQMIYKQLQSENLVDIEQVVKLQEESEKLYKICKDILEKNKKS